TSEHRAFAELAELLTVLLAVDDCRLQRGLVPLRGNGRQSFEWQCRRDGRPRWTVEGEGIRGIVDVVVLNVLGDQFPNDLREWQRTIQRSFCQGIDRIRVHEKS